MSHKEQLKLLVEAWYREIKNVENGFHIVEKNIDPPFAKETKQEIEYSIRALLFVSSLLLRNLERE